MILSREEQAARNNALWCDSMCRAHGVPGEFHETAWLYRHPVPRFHSNLVTLSNQRQTAAQLALIRELAASHLPEHWTIKDSFRESDLQPLGFQPLFEANWIWRAASTIARIGLAGRMPWGRLQDEAELAAWENAWKRDPANTSPTQPARQFLPALLTDPNVAFIAAHQGGEIIAGAILNRTGKVVGLSNIFVPPEDGASFWAGCVALSMQIFPGMPLVGYERGPELAIAESLGFEKLHPLRVWVHRP